MHLNVTQSNSDLQTEREMETGQKRERWSVQKRAKNFRGFLCPTGVNRNNSQLFLKDRSISSEILWLWLIGQPACLSVIWLAEKGCISRWLDGPDSFCNSPFLFPATPLGWDLLPFRGSPPSSSLSVSSSAKLAPYREHIN